MVCEVEVKEGIGVLVLVLEPRETVTCKTTLKEYAQQLCQMFSDRSQSNPSAGSPKFQLSENAESALMGILEGVRRDYSIEEVYKIYYSSVVQCYEMKRCHFDNVVSSWLCGMGADPDWRLPSEKCLLHGVISQNECLADIIYELGPTADLWCAKETVLHYAAWRIKCPVSLGNFKTLVDYGYSIHLKDYHNRGPQTVMKLSAELHGRDGRKHFFARAKEALDYTSADRLKRVYEARRVAILTLSSGYSLPKVLGELLVSFSLVQQWKLGSSPPT